jgi:hypothetical protein
MVGDAFQTVEDLAELYAARDPFETMNGIFANNKHWE